MTDNTKNEGKSSFSSFSAAIDEKPLYETDKLYDVKLARPVFLFGVMHSPMHVNHIAGQYIADLGDAVIDATAI